MGIISKCIGIIAMENNCCKNRMILIMERRRVDEDKERITYACECACGGWNTTACESIEEAIYHYKLMNVGAPIYTYKLYLPCDFAEQMDAIKRAYQDMRKIEQQFRRKTETEDMMEVT